MTFKNLLAGAAALGLAAAPVAATAGTRAASSLPTMDSGSMTLGARTSTAVKKDEQLAGGAGIIIAVLALAAVIAGVIIAADDDRTD